VGWKAQGKKVDPSAANKNSADHCKSFAPAFRWHANMGKSKHRVVAGDARRHGIEEPDYRAEERGANRREYNLSNRLGRAAGEDTDNECADDTRAASEGCEAALSHWPRIGDFRADLAGDERPKALIFRHDGCERPALLTSKANERDNARRINDGLARKIVRQRPARLLDPCPFALLSLLPLV
jgi:hypothetical protein